MKKTRRVGRPSQQVIHPGPSIGQRVLPNADQAVAIGSFATLPPGVIVYGANPYVEDEHTGLVYFFENRSAPLRG